MAVHGLTAAQQLHETLGAESAIISGTPDRRGQRKTPAHPIPEFKDILGGNAPCLRRPRIGGHGNDVPAQGGPVLKMLQQPFAGSGGVGHGLLGGERLRGQDEQRRLRREGTQRLGQVAGIEVGDEMDLQVALGVEAQGGAGHARAQVRAADADVNDVAQGAAAESDPVPRAHAAGGGGHPLPDLADARHDVDAADPQRATGRIAQRPVQCRPALGLVDLLAGEQAPGFLLQAAGPGQGEQQLHRLVVDRVFGIIEINALGLEGIAPAALRVGGEKIAQVPPLHAGGVLLQGQPLGHLRPASPVHGAPPHVLYRKRLVKVNSAASPPDRTQCLPCRTGERQGGTPRLPDP